MACGCGAPCRFWVRPHTKFRACLTLQQLTLQKKKLTCIFNKETTKQHQEHPPRQVSMHLQRSF
jgi:hypothetical protein